MQRYPLHVLLRAVASRPKSNTFFRQLDGLVSLQKTPPLAFTLAAVFATARARSVTTRAGFTAEFFTI
jgi:hypothetical protein